MTGTRVGPDGVPRCPWALQAPDYAAYHDTEWGVAVHGEAAIFERLTLEAFQAGLSWLTILRKRPAFREAFSGFDPEAVARYDDRRVAELLVDSRIVRNRRKVEAAVGNAAAVLLLRERGGLDRLFWSFAPRSHRRPRTVAEVPAATAESAALAAALRRAGLVFVGPTTAYAAMQACGVVDDHLAGCHRAAAP